LDFLKFAQFSFFLLQFFFGEAARRMSARATVRAQRVLRGCDALRCVPRHTEFLLQIFTTAQSKKTEIFLFIIKSFCFGAVLHTKAKAKAKGHD
jgi:hypothetical protein